MLCVRALVELCTRVFACTPCMRMRRRVPGVVERALQSRKPGTASSAGLPGTGVGAGGKGGSGAGGGGGKGGGKGDGAKGDSAGSKKGWVKAGGGRKEPAAASEAAARRDEPGTADGGVKGERERPGWAAAGAYLQSAAPRASGYDGVGDDDEGRPPRTAPLGRAAALTGEGGRWRDCSRGSVGGGGSALVWQRAACVSVVAASSPCCCGSHSSIRVHAFALRASSQVPSFRAPFTPRMQAL